jgi:iron complex outermembrane receptor protein
MVGDIDTRFATRSFLATDFLPQEEQPAYAVLNASLTYYLPGDRWSVALWGRNLSDKIVYGTTFERPSIGVAGAPDLFYTIPGDPRTYGVSLRVKF